MQQFFIVYRQLCIGIYPTSSLGHMHPQAAEKAAEDRDSQQYRCPTVHAEHHKLQTVLLLLPASFAQQAQSMPLPAVKQQTKK
jgi:hypothetical protein